MSTNEMKKEQEEDTLSLSILDTMKRHLEDAHVQYCRLLELYELLIDTKRQEEIVLTFVDCQVVSELFQPILHIHQEKEQVQIQLTRVLTIACKIQVKKYNQNHSGRLFQLECGRFFLWKDIEKMRVQHPQVSTLQANCLMAFEAMTLQNEFHTIQLVQEENMMIWTTILEFIQQSTQEHALIVASVHLLRALCFFPRIVEWISSQILMSTCQSLVYVLIHKSPNDLSLARKCVQTIHLLVHKKSRVTNIFSLQSTSSSPICIHALFGGVVIPPPQNNGGGEVVEENRVHVNEKGGGGGEWLILLLDRWQAFPCFLYELVALVTDIFATPQRYEQIAHTLVGTNGFVWRTFDMMTRILLFNTPWGTNTPGGGGGQTVERENFQNHILYLECLRALRQLMSIQNVLVDAIGDVDVKYSLLPRLLQLLDQQFQTPSTNATTGSFAPSSPFYPKDLQIQFEWLLLLQRIGQAKDLYQQTFIQNGLNSKIRTYLKPSTLQQNQNENQKLFHLVEREYIKAIFLFPEKKNTPSIPTTTTTSQLKNRHRGGGGGGGEQGRTIATRSGINTTTSTTTNMGSRHHFSRQASSSFSCSSPSTKVRQLQPLVKQSTTPTSSDTPPVPVPVLTPGPTPTPTTAASTTRPQRNPPTTSSRSSRSIMTRGSIHTSGEGIGSSSSRSSTRSMSLLPSRQSTEEQNPLGYNHTLSEQHEGYRIIRGSRRRTFRLSQV